MVDNSRSVLQTRNWFLRSTKELSENKIREWLGEHKVRPYEKTCPVGAMLVVALWENICLTFPNREVILGQILKPILVHF